MSRNHEDLQIIWNNKSPPSLPYISAHIPIEICERAKKKLLETYTKVSIHHRELINGKLCGQIKIIS